ncbi:MAG TPA: LUD domain-containing protein [Pirellulales bacterium]|nr:LUD domain-containing protein [Pirellulales bacterium]
MTSRDKILTAIRKARLPAADLPPLERDWITYPDPLEQFGEVLRQIGGAMVRVADRAELAHRLEELPVYRDARQALSLVEGAGRTTIDWHGIDDPHALETVDFAILPGQFGVAENGAVWVTDRGVRQRAIYFIVQHLALAISSASILHNMHQAYERLELGGAEFGAFIAGPSKTADIEQSLVVGAHGPRSMTVFCVDSAEPTPRFGV